MSCWPFTAHTVTLVGFTLVLSLPARESYWKNVCPRSERSAVCVSIPVLEGYWENDGTGVRS